MSEDTTSTTDTNIMTTVNTTAAAEDSPFWKIGTVFGIEIAWIIVGSAVLLCICCCGIVWMLYRRRKKTSAKKIKTKPRSASEHIEVVNGVELHYKTTVSGQKMDRVDHTQQPRNDVHRTSQVEENNFNRVLHDRSTSVANNPLHLKQSPQSVASYSSQQVSPLHASAQAPPSNPRPHSLPLHYHHSSALQQPMGGRISMPMQQQQHMAMPQRISMQNIPSYSNNSFPYPQQQYAPQQQPQQMHVHGGSFNQMQMAHMHAGAPHSQSHVHSQSYHQNPPQMAHSMPVQNFGFSQPQSNFQQPFPQHINTQQDHLHESEEPETPATERPDSPVSEDDENQVEVVDTLTSIVNAAKKKEKQMTAVSSIELNRQPSDSTSL